MTRIAITLGDPRGIGPEVTASALAHPSIEGAAGFVVVGPEGLVPGHDEEAIGRWTVAGSALDAGRLAGLAIERAVEMALSGEVDAIVTAPIEKNAFRSAGWSYPGHTEMLRELTGAPTVGMMMSAERTIAGPPLRVILATTHLALRDVPAAVTEELLVEQGVLTDRALRDWWAISAPRLALCALNPHAGDGGLFGDEEERVLAPAIAALRARGVDAIGPVPADTVFTRALKGDFHAVVAPYHDVGMAAFKTMSFGGGVNVTLGLPFPRTSPDHGTALDIAGQNRADPASMVEAIRTAISLAARFDSPAGES